MNYFNEITSSQLVETDNKIGSSSYFSDLSSMQVGFGSKMMRADKNGMWLGAQNFSDAPFSVDMDGNVIAKSADFSASGYTKINIFKQTSIPTSISVGDLWFDTDNGNKMYRSASSGANEIKAGEWEPADDERKTSVFAQSSVPTSLAIGDLWYKTSDNNRPYTAKSVGADQITAGEWELIEDARAADALLKSGTSQVLSGDFGVGSTQVKIDGVNGRIIINDGTNDRILIGYLLNGF